MATKLFLRSTTNNGIGGYHDMLTSAGAGSTTGVVNTVGSGTQIQWTATAGGAVLEWISGRVPAGGFTLSGTMTFSIWAQESNGQANCGARARVFKRAADGTETEIGGGPWNDGVEFGTSAAEMVWTGTPTSTAFAENDRIIVRYYITNIGTMGNGRTCTITYNAADAATGDSFFQINENVTFKSEAQTGDVGVATETDTSLALGQAMTSGLATETDSALALTGTLALTTGRADEADTALALNGAMGVGLATETDSALALGVALAPGVAEESSLALAPGATLAQSPGIAEESSLALPLGATAARSPSAALESDEALAPGGTLAWLAGLASSTDEAIQLPMAMSVGLAQETDTALALEAGSTNTYGRADETDEALSLAATLIREAGLAAEADVALFLSGVQARDPGVSTESDQALALTAGGQNIMAEETDEALALSALSALAPGIAMEIDEALSLYGGSGPGYPPRERCADVEAVSRGAQVAWPERTAVVERRSRLGVVDYGD